MVDDDDRAGINEQLLNAVCAKNYGEVQRLVKSGANVNSRHFICKAPSAFGWYRDDHVDYYASLLSFAVIAGNFGIVEYLVENGANVLVEEECGNSPMELALQQHNLAIATYFAKHGAKFDIYSGDCRHILRDCASDETCGFVVQILRDAVCNGALSTVKVLIENGADANSPDEKGLLLTNLAKKNNRTQILTYLLQMGADVSLTESLIALWVNDYSDNTDYRWCITIKGTDIPVGGIDVTNIINDSTCEIGFVLPII